MTGWNGLDFFVFLILAVNTILGISRGAAKEIISMMCLSAALIFTIKFTVPLANFFNESPLISDVIDSIFTHNFMRSLGLGPLSARDLKETMYSISLLVNFVGVFSLCEATLKYSGFLEVYSFPIATLNRKLGGTLGFTRGYIISLIFLSILALHLFTQKDRDDAMIHNSFFVKLFSSQMIKLDQLISGQNPENYHQLYENKPYSEEQIYQQLKVPTTPSTPGLPSPPGQPQQRLKLYW